ncbi:DUF805 domain-containing protein [Flavivirga rizhaonensis]|uniref:DUF805 domain-containing protein n=1 Tax=Flavivirga rizhaonensis TaxID=2559571 RepID=A0A4S1DUY9_9FLAO|nr:DUF805 domain-containing protein [Flavivirga rizhaonensis]TGV01242.1 DUF805 domain-containing protein [Flavivirga rizhaonensis]
MKWYLKVLINNYATFSGRARRKEFWMFFLFNLIIIFGLSLLLDFISGFFDYDIVPLVLGIYLLGILIPYFGVAVRRLHDSGKSGGYIFVYFIPFIGGIWFLILMATEGDKGPNQYGPDPKSPNSDEIDDIGKPLLDN